MATRIEFELKRLSICQCDSSTLDDRISLGRKYKIAAVGNFPIVVSGFSYECGNCGKQQEVSGVLAEETDGRLRAIPADLFKEEYGVRPVRQRRSRARAASV